MEKILVALPVEENHRELFRNAAPQADISFIPMKEVTEEQVREATIIFGNVNPAWLTGSPNLKWLQLNSAGTDRYIVPGVFPEQAVLTNATGAYGLALSEHMLAMLLYMMKRFRGYTENQLKSSWMPLGQVDSVYGSRILMIGMGDVGNEFARKVYALGAHVKGIRRTPSEKPEYLEELGLMEDLERLLPWADVVVSALPGTKATYHVFDRDVFSKMRPGTYFINVGRGGAVDHDALLCALQSGHLKGASIDVTEPEPFPAEHPLWKEESCLITPHVSGGYYLPETFERIVRISVDNLRRFLAGDELNNIVDFSTGYRRHL